MLAELQADYKSKLLGLYDEQYKLGYWVGYVEGDRDARRGHEESPRSTLE